LVAIELQNLSYYKGLFFIPRHSGKGNLDGLKAVCISKIDFENLKTEVIPSNLRLGHKIEHLLFAN